MRPNVFVLFYTRAASIYKSKRSSVRQSDVSCVTIERLHVSKAAFQDRIRQSLLSNFLQMRPSFPRPQKIQQIDPSQPKLTQDLLHAGDDKIFLQRQCWITIKCKYWVSTWICNDTNNTLMSFQTRKTFVHLWNTN